MKRGRGRVFVGAGLILAAILPLTGCTRTRYRLAADKEVDCLLREKMDDPRWTLSNFAIEQDPRSRSYDPCNRDFPPMPPDDPESHRFMHEVAGHHGWPRWHEYGDIQQIENPYWMQYLPQYTERMPDGSIRLSLVDCVHLSLIHDPDYQTQLETLYLSALDVSTERFRFDVQFTGNANSSFNSIGSDIPGGPSNNVTLASGLTVSKQFATAAQLLVNFANTTVWNFGGPNSGFTMSLLNFSLIQPLLQGGGRVLALEQLTLAERTLLYNLRAMIRYRQGNYTNVAIGELAVATLSRAGGFAGGTGLTGFTGSGASGFGGVGDITGFARTNAVTSTGASGGIATGFAGGGAATVGGFIGLLQQLTQIRNSQELLNSETQTLALLEANLEAGFIDLAQVDQFRQTIETERANILQARENLQLSLDTFKAAQMGLPPSLEISLDDSLVKQFEFTDPRLDDLENRIADAIKAFGLLPKNPPLAKMQQSVADADELGRILAAHLPGVRDELKRLESRLPEREKSMTEPEKQQLTADRAKLAQTLGDLEARLKVFQASLADVRSRLTEQTRQAAADRFVDLLVDISNISGELSLVQGRARLEQTSVEVIKLEPKDALEISRANRLDWMNARASVVDTWRLVEFNANALQANLTLAVNGSILTPVGHNPFDFHGELGSGSVQLQYSPPLTRLSQRNTFRQQLIEYQQDRRGIISYEDTISRNLRQLLRDLYQLRINLEIQRRAVAIAIRRVDQTRDLLSKPAPPPAPGAQPTPLGPTAALNLLTALSDLRTTKNAFISIWINYHSDKMRLLRELGLLQIDDQGVWIEETIENAVRRSSDEEPLPPNVPPQWFQEGLTPAPGQSPVLPPPPAPAVNSVKRQVPDPYGRTVLTSQ